MITCFSLQRWSFAPAAVAVGRFVRRRVIDRGAVFVVSLVAVVAERGQPAEGRAGGLSPVLGTPRAGSGGLRASKVVTFMT
jgi:hypothetical protein